jgi:NADH:ubiquinone oxidoreductase subunit 5 (subunit L)/multisubunit Na+/H+ antiporter MnhA subunit
MQTLNPYLLTGGIKQAGQMSELLWPLYGKTEGLFITVSLLVVLVAMTKTAQIHFPSWFPAAMAACNPAWFSSLFNLGYCCDLLIHLFYWT